ncbi:hypothetical protein L210DRAFT_842835, partial [Boletus edulis BED1]
AHLILKEYNHTACDPSRPEGCVRCSPTRPSVCCDLDSPSQFMSLDPPIPPALPKNPARSHVDTKYTMEAKEVDLCNALEEWRVAKAVNERGEACVMDYGPGFILPTATIDRIVNCAHHSKLRTVDDLRKETRWSGVALYGTEVLAIVNIFIPQQTNTPALVRAPLLPRPVLQPCVQSTDLLPAPASTSGTKKNKCSACGLPGHNSTVFSLSMEFSLLTVIRT